MMNKRVLVIDALNMWFRAYIVDPSLSANGQPIGGLKGFFKILQKLMRDTNPDKVIICWDGAGGSQKRKSMAKNYKAGRKPIRLNRSIRNMSESEEIENKIWQQTRLIDYLNNTPIIQLMFEAIEADDIISAVVQHSSLKGWQKVIVSSDQDFFQLCDEETVVFRPVQKEVLNTKRIVEKYGIHPTNFALARAIAGDKSDNLSGVDGVGLPTVSKRLPFLTEEKTSTLDQVLGYCEEKQEDSTLKAYQNIIEQFDRVKLNYKMMQLYSPSISIQTKQRIDQILENFEYELNKTEIRKMMIQDGFGETSWNDLFANLSNIISQNKQVSK
jgi:DNA polymerase-1